MNSRYRLACAGGFAGTHGRRGPAGAAPSWAIRRKRSGWGTWIRTRTNGVRVRSSTVKLSPTVAPQAALSGAFRGDTVCRIAGAAAVARSIDAPAGSVYPPTRSFHRHCVTPPESGCHGRATPSPGRCPMAATRPLFRRGPADGTGDSVAHRAGGSGGAISGMTASVPSGLRVMARGRPALSL